jgi:hypothetical protein
MLRGTEFGYLKIIRRANDLVGEIKNCIDGDQEPQIAWNTPVSPPGIAITSPGCDFM